MENQVKRRQFSDEFKMSLVSQFVSGEKTGYRICKENGIAWSVLSEWIRRFVPSSRQYTEPMKPKNPDQEEINSLRKQLLEKEKELKRERMRGDFYETMVKVAEEELKIPIRKKAGTRR